MKTPNKIACLAQLNKTKKKLTNCSRIFKMSNTTNNWLALQTAEAEYNRLFTLYINI